MLVYAELQNRWKLYFRSLTGEKLIDVFNQEIQKRGWTSTRALFLKICIEEMLERK